MTKELNTNEDNIIKIIQEQKDEKIWENNYIKGEN